MENICVGNSVEICSNEDGFLGSYYQAKVVGKCGAGATERLMVEYKTLVTEEDETKLLREVVKASEVRPVPPEIIVPEFNVLDKVDAFDNDGWWVGRITGKDAYKYYVYFESSRDEFLYPFHRLRIHQEYEKGQWIPSRAGQYGVTKF